jgi:hypothetical protein
VTVTTFDSDGNNFTVNANVTAPAVVANSTSGGSTVATLSYNVEVLLSPTATVIATTAPVVIAWNLQVFGNPTSAQNSAEGAQGTAASICCRRPSTPKLWKATWRPVSEAH